MVEKVIGRGSTITRWTNDLLKDFGLGVKDKGLFVSCSTSSQSCPTQSSSESVTAHDVSSKARHSWNQVSC